MPEIRRLARSHDELRAVLNVLFRSAVNFSAVDEGSPIPDNVSRPQPMKDKSMLWMAAFGIALFLFFACPR
jgi:hypothetical protein